VTFDDVRMRGFRSRAAVDDVVAWLDARARPNAAEDVALSEAAGRVLARDVASEVDVPSFRRAAMDGYALAGAETFGATESEPLTLRLEGDVRPGADAGPRVAPGTAARIRTGAPLPEGADAVLPAELAELRGDALFVRGEVAPGRHVGRVGEDVEAGTTLLRAGRVLRPQDVGLLSSIGVARATVFARPRVLVVTTGDEVLPAGSRAFGSHVADANAPLLAALASRDGARVRCEGPLPDGDPRLEDAIARGDADVVIVAGASSVGPDDVAPSLAAHHGRVVFHGIAVRPASPTGFAVVAGRVVALLPGNPVSALCAYDLLVGRLVRGLGGHAHASPYRVERLPLARKASSELGRTDYLRVRIDAGRVVPLTASGAGILSSAVRADGFVVIPAACEGYPENALVEVHCYDGTTESGPGHRD